MLLNNKRLANGIHDVFCLRSKFWSRSNDCYVPATVTRHGFVTGSVDDGTRHVYPFTTACVSSGTSIDALFPGIYSETSSLCSNSWQKLVCREEVCVSRGLQRHSVRLFGTLWRISAMWEWLRRGCLLQWLTSTFNSRKIFHVFLCCKFIFWTIHNII